MVHSMPLKNVSGQSYKARIRTFGSSLVQCAYPDDCGISSESTLIDKVLVHGHGKNLNYKSTGTLTNSGDPHELLQIVEYLQALHFLLR